MGTPVTELADDGKTLIMVFPPRDHEEAEKHEMLSVFEMLDPVDRAHVLRLSRRLADWHAR